MKADGTIRIRVDVDPARREIGSGQRAADRLRRMPKAAAPPQAFPSAPCADRGDRDPPD